MGRMHELPVIDTEEPPGRADAARNRERILCAARRLFAIKAGWHETVRRTATPAV